MYILPVLLLLLVLVVEVVVAAAAAAAAAVVVAVMLLSFFLYIFYFYFLILLFCWTVGLCQTKLAQFQRHCTPYGCTVCQYRGVGGWYTAVKKTRQDRRQRNGGNKRQGRKANLTEWGTAANWSTTEAVERPTTATVIPIPARRFCYAAASSDNNSNNNNNTTTTTNV